MRHQWHRIYPVRIALLRAGQHRLKSVLPATRKRFRPKKLLGFGFKTLVVNRARSLICGGKLPRDLVAERHAGHKIRGGTWRMNGRGLARPGRHKGGPTTGGSPPREHATATVVRSSNAV